MRKLAACFAVLAVLAALPALSSAWPVEGLLLAPWARQYSDVHILPQGPGRFIASFTSAYNMTRSDLTSCAVYGGFDATTGSGWAEYNSWPYPDGADGFFVYDIEDFPNAPGLRHVSSGLPNPLWPSIPVAISGFKWWAAPDGAGGVYVLAGSPECLFRYTPEGVIAPGWPAGGVFLTSAPQYPASSPLVVDASGRATVILIDGVNTLRFVRVLPDGTRDPESTSVALPGFTSPMGFRLFADGDGYCVTWRDTATYVARFGLDGELRPGWPVKATTNHTPIELCHLEVFSDGSGGCFVFCSSPDQEGHIAAPVCATHVLADGTAAPGWSLPAAAVSLPGTGAISTTSYFAGPDSLGGAFLGWGGRLTRLVGDHALAPDWAASGDVVTANGVQADGYCSLGHLWLIAEEAVVGDGTGAALVIVRVMDSCTDPFQALRMVRFTPTGLAGVTTGAPRATLGVELLGANPAAGARRFALALDHSAPAAFEVLDVAGRVVSREFVAAAGVPGSRDHVWSPPAAARPGVYFARLTQRGASRATRFVVLD